MAVNMKNKYLKEFDEICRKNLAHYRSDLPICVKLCYLRKIQ